LGRISKATNPLSGAEKLSVVPRTVRGVNPRERAVHRAAHDIWDRTGRPVSADTIAPAAGFDYATTQQVLNALFIKGYFTDALRGDDPNDSVSF
jgi:hypothetical protein